LAKYTRRAFYNARFSSWQPRGKAARKLELKGSFDFPAAPLPWSLTGGAQSKRVGGSVLVDTDGDLKPETLLFGTSNFWPGWSPDGRKPAPKYCYLCEPESCHIDPSTGKEHCTGPIYACNGAQCP